MAYLRGIFYSLPVQLLFLHFRKYQVLLVFWFVLFSVANGSFMKSFGADALLLAPEYLGNVTSLGMFIMGITIGVFIMSWNITTFILFSRHFTFLAATQYPFLKYCINNSVIPVTFLLFYLVKAYQFQHYKELINNVEIIFLTGGFIAGLLMLLTISFFYFFRADKNILKKLQPLFNNAKNYIAQLQPEHAQKNGGSLIYSEWFLDSFFHVRRCRDVSHYSRELMEKIFKQHHFAAVISVFVAYIFLILIGLFLDYRFFQLPAGASITLFFAILIGVSGALVYFFQSWSVPAFILFLLLLNVLYSINLLDPHSKAYGLNYNTSTRPLYTQAALDSENSIRNQEADKRNMEAILNRWKARQGEEKPLFIILATSGGGTRSATFTMNVLQHLNSITGSQIMKKTFLITGSSGGMIGATYFRELYREKIKGKDINLESPEYVNNIAEDLLNPTFTSFVAKDIFGPQQKFSVGKYTYLRDRGYAFENALDQNTGGILNKRLKDYVYDESQANIPLILYHSVVTRDGKMMLFNSQPMRFMMAPPKDSADNTLPPPDAVDFTSFFAGQDPYNLRMLSILRMNATFPIVLPNVWLPSQPQIDVMDGGLRDNYGVENALRFLSHMQHWIEKNTRGVLVLQIRDRMDGGWENPYAYDNLTENAVKPFFLLQNNWYKMMEYFQSDMSTYFLNNSGYPIHKISFQYIPNKEENKAALNFHLTLREKLDIAASLNSQHNQQNFEKVLQLLSAKGK